ncbi:hypothetical protein PHLGIDRAFT_405876 [Phlebiopsis gigantea 11061_1 CR5-6]|uniref:Uncharacterized protein n=1 Tax=Phlebiopsis gigantea (strain 11061_1 CR5-6) TaxID=745531 RepID=A0A0C3RY73_PHLG1|nr:hypothetical protein PHLGIDRAFT_405876 [Phlebiopsis gigantea 11061_1 CR5-6]
MTAFHSGCSLQGFKICLCEFPHTKETPCFSISQVPGPALPVQRTKITAFSEDYQQPAAPKKLRSVTAYLRVVYCVPGSNQRLYSHYTPAPTRYVSCRNYQQIG